MNKLNLNLSHVVGRRWLFFVRLPRCLLLVLAVVLCTPEIAFAQTWKPLGPGPNTLGQVENIANREVVGAVNALAVHPTDPKVVYLGAVNGGIWMSRNATDVHPAWQQLTDSQKSLSIGALTFDPTDGTNKTLIAGIGVFSSYGAGGARIGVLRSIDGGATWNLLDGGGPLRGLNISGVASRGEVLVIAVNQADSPSRAGIWRSTNTGASWKQVSSDPATGLPAGASSDLKGDPNSAKCLYTHAGGNGLFCSEDAGATWTKVSDKNMDAVLSVAGNVKIAVGAAKQVYVAVVQNGILAGLFRSANGSAPWTSLDLPSTLENGKARFGIHVGRQGGIHLSLAADITDANLLYVGGDRQPCFTEAMDCQDPDTPAWPNSLGAGDFSGRLFRVDASLKSGNQVAPLTHVGTLSKSAPHADSRNMGIAPDGTLIEVSDGGIYRRTKPATDKGDWFSMNGTLQTTEFHALAWDANAHVAIGGAQDTGTPEQSQKTDPRWRSVSTGDGGVVAVDDFGVAGLSTRYSSYYGLSDFRRRVYSSANVLQSDVRPPMTVIAGEKLTPQFYTPLKLNAVTPNRFILGAANGVYESLDQGDTFTEIGPNIRVNDFGRTAIAYGAAQNPNVLYVGAGTQVFVRTAAAPAALSSAMSYPGGFVVAIVVTPNDPQTAFVADLSRIFRTKDAGTTWTDVSGNLAKLVPGNLHSITFSSETAQGALVVSSDNGIFTASGPDFSTWRRLGTGLPQAPVYQVEYSAKDRILLAGTLGRGAWMLDLTGQFGPKGVVEGVGVPGSLPPQPKEKSGGKNVSAVQLCPGVMVDGIRGRIIIMSPKGGMEALDLTRGEVAWTTKEAAKPLALAGNRLVAQAEAPAEGNGLKVVVLDAATGKTVSSGKVALPAGVKPSINETFRGKFVVQAHPGLEEAMISWNFVEQPRRGVKPGVPDALTPTGTPPKTEAITPAARSLQGAARINFNTGATAPLNALETPISPPRPVLLPAADRLGGLPETQFSSADGRHVLVSKQVGGGTDWDKYLLTLYERSAGLKVGEFKSHLSTVPFVVSDGQVIFETGPYARRGPNGQLEEEPLTVRSIDLKTGAQRWARPVRDTALRGPFPP